MKGELRTERSHLVQALLTGDDGIVVPTEITLGCYCGPPTFAVSLASPVFGWTDLLVV